MIESFDFTDPLAADPTDELARPSTVAHAADSSAPDAPTPGERRLAEQLGVAGWVAVEVVPAHQRIYDTPGSIEIVGLDDADRSWRLHADGGDDGRIEGYTIARNQGGACEESERIVAHAVPDPNAAVGAWEALRRRAVEDAQPQGKDARARW